MNIELVNSLVKVIEALPEEERSLLEKCLSRKQTWETLKQRLHEIHSKIQSRQGWQPLEFDAEEAIQQGRQDRTEAIMDACFPGSALE